MVLTVHLLFLVMALVCFALAALGIPSRVGLEPLGLFFLTLAMIF